jgi:hypothetical protein
MLSTQEMRRIAFARLSDAEALHRAKRFDGASYLCGYSVELALKARICKTLKWAGYPQTNAEFQGLASFKVHDLEMLLRLSGKAAIVKGKYLARMVRGDDLEAGGPIQSNWNGKRDGCQDHA